MGVDKREEEPHRILLPQDNVDAMGAVGVVAGGGEQPVCPFGEVHISVAQQRIPTRPAGHVHVVVDGCGAGGEEVPEGAGVEGGWPVAGEEEAADVTGVGAALEECVQFGALFGVGGGVAVDEVSWLEPDNGSDHEAMGAGHPRAAERWRVGPGDPGTGRSTAPANPATSITSNDNIAGHEGKRGVVGVDDDIPVVSARDPPGSDGFGTVGYGIEDWWADRGRKREGESRGEHGASLNKAVWFQQHA